MQHQFANRLCQAAGGRGVEQDLYDLMAARITVQLRAHVLQIVFNLLARARYVTGTKALGDQGDFVVIGILLGAWQVWVAVT